MTKQPETCGFGNRYKKGPRRQAWGCGFGESSTSTSTSTSTSSYTLGPTNSNLDSFYVNGTANIQNLNKCVNQTLSGFYNAPVTRFGKKIRKNTFKINNDILYLRSL